MKIVSPRKVGLRNIFKRRLDFIQNSRHQLESSRSKNKSASAERLESVASTDRISRIEEARGLRKFQSLKRESSRYTTKGSQLNSEIQSLRLLDLSKDRSKATPMKLRIRKIKKLNKRSNINTTNLKFFSQKREQKSPTRTVKQEMKPLNSTLSMIGLQQVYKGNSQSPIKKHRDSGQSAVSKTFLHSEREFKGRHNQRIRFEEREEARRERSKEEWLSPLETEEYKRQQYKLLLLRERELEKAHKRNQQVISDYIRAQRDFATYESYVAEELQLAELTCEMEDFICDLVKPLAGPIDELADESLIRDVHVQQTLSNYGCEVLHNLSRFNEPDRGTTSMDIFWKSMALTSVANKNEVKRFQAHVSGQFSCIQIFPSRQYLRVSCSHTLSNPVIEIPAKLRPLSNTKLINSLQFYLDRSSERKGVVSVLFVQQVSKELRKLNSLFWLAYKQDGPYQQSIQSQILCKGRVIFPRFMDIGEKVRVEVEISSRDLTNTNYEQMVPLDDIRKYGLNDREFRRYLSQNINFNTLQF